MSGRYRGLMCGDCIHDWCVYGRVIDAKSAFLAMNLTASQRAYAMELYRERKERSK